MDGCGILNIDGYVIGTLKVDRWNDDSYTKDRWIDGWICSLHQHEIPLHKMIMMRS